MCSYSDTDTDPHGHGHVNKNVLLYSKNSKRKSIITVKLKTK